MENAPGILAAILTFAVWLFVAKATLAAMRCGSGGQRLGFWQLTLTQLFILCVVLAALCWALRIVYLDRFGPV